MYFQIQPTSPLSLCFLRAIKTPPRLSRSPTALSAKTVAIMAHNKGLELGADMVLLLWGRQGRRVEEGLGWCGGGGPLKKGGGGGVCPENNTLGL